MTEYLEKKTALESVPEKKVVKERQFKGMSLTERKQARREK